MKNKIGAITEAGFLTFWFVTLGLNLIASQLPITKDVFRTRKAVKKCTEELGGKDFCKDYVSAMSKEAKLDYIRDDEIPTDRGFAK